MSTQTASLTIGAVAKRVGVAIDTIRYYEREGLLPEPLRRASGYRSYDEGTIAQLRFIRRAKELGFTLEPFGPDAWVIRAIPALLPMREAEATVRELLSRAEAVGVVSRQPDDDPLRRTIACHSAVRAGDVLTVEQMEQIIERLKETQHPLTCPHGRPTGIMISLAELNRRCLRS